MNQNQNSISSYTQASLLELQDAAGITQFPTETSWYQTINGLQIQGGLATVLASATLAVDFQAPYEKQLLGIFLQPVGAAPNGGYPTVSSSLEGFDIVNGATDLSYYWWAIGV